MADMREQVGGRPIQEEIIRVVRIVEYIGDRKWVEGTLKKSIQGTLYLNDYPKCLRCIRTATITDIPERLNSGEVETLEEYLKRKSQR